MLNDQFSIERSEILKRFSSGWSPPKKSNAPPSPPLELFTKFPLTNHRTYANHFTMGLIFNQASEGLSRALATKTAREKGSKTGIKENTSMARIGKIARLPRLIRSELNSRLQDGQEGKQIVLWLNSLPEVKALLAQSFDARPINEQNLSDWRQRGYEEWLARQDLFAQARQLAADRQELQSVAPGCSFTDHLADALAFRFGALLGRPGLGTGPTLPPPTPRPGARLPDRRQTAPQRSKCRPPQNPDRALGTGPPKNPHRQRRRPQAPPERRPGRSDLGRLENGRTVGTIRRRAAHPVCRGLPPRNRILQGPGPFREQSHDP